MPAPPSAALAVRACASAKIGFWVFGQLSAEPCT
ncbi:Uncharacterised protein [Mycobacteroides abscessus subsp. abscessus]|nr:Uncharacterised protein [Mycobacteroides abscessus subsp. abscessus]